MDVVYQECLGGGKNRDGCSGQKTYERPHEIQRQKNTILTQENQKESSGFEGYQTFFEAGIRMNTTHHTETPHKRALVRAGECRCRVPPLFQLVLLQTAPCMEMKLGPRHTNKGGASARTHKETKEKLFVCLFIGKTTTTKRSVGWSTLVQTKISQQLLDGLTPPKRIHLSGFSDPQIFPQTPPQGWHFWIFNEMCQQLRICHLGDP